MFNEEDIKRLIGWALIIGLIYLGMYLFMPGENSETEKVLIDRIEEVQVERDSARAEARREREMRIKVKIQYDEQIKRQNEFVESVERAIDGNDVHALDSLASRIEHAARQR